MTGGEALLRWGRHDDGCPAPATTGVDIRDCTCGLIAAIALRLRQEEHERAVAEHARILGECRREDAVRARARTRPPPTSLPEPHAIVALPDARVVAGASSGIRRWRPVVIAATLSAVAVNIIAAIARYLIP